MSIEVIPKIHRIRLAVTEFKPQGYVLQLYNKPPSTPKKIYKAKVRVVGRTDYELTNESGEVKLEFGGSDNFEIEVLPPDDADYESSTKSFTGIACSKDFRNENITLNKASRVRKLN